MQCFFVSKDYLLAVSSTVVDRHGQPWRDSTKCIVFSFQKTTSWRSRRPLSTVTVDRSLAIDQNADLFSAWLYRLRRLPHALSQIFGNACSKSCLDCQCTLFTKGNRRISFKKGSAKNYRFQKTQVPLPRVKDTEGMAKLSIVCSIVFSDGCSARKCLTDNM